MTAEKQSTGTILVTGGAGFIGSHLCQALLRAGWDIATVDNFNDYYQPQFKRENVAETAETAQKSGRRFALFEGDIRDLDFLDRTFRQCLPVCVIHLAACAGVRPSIEDPVLYTSVNINGTVNILECMKKYGTGKLLFASSSSVYGNNRKVPFSEADPVDHPISPYAATKKAGELLCHTYHHLYGISTACLRFFTVYGPGQRPDLAISKFTKLILEGKAIPFYGDGSTKRDYTFIDDITNGVLKALDWVNEGDRYDIFNLGESNTISLSEMVSTLEKALNRHAVLDIRPAQPGDVELTYADIAKAKRELGYDPSTCFADGISAFVEWFRLHRM